MSHQPFSGVITAIITPFKTDGEVDFPTFHNLLKLQKKAGIHGVVVLGTTGENPTLTELESEKLVLAALEHRSEDFHIYVGSGTNDTKQTITKSIKYSNLKFEKNKPDGIMVVTPYYNKPNNRHLIRHFKEVFQEIPNTPTCVYNVPSRTGINLSPQTFAQIAFENSNVVAIKEAAGNVNAITEMRIELNKINKKDISILSGDDATYTPALLSGANGVISVTTNLIPTAMIDIFHAIKNGDFQKAQKLHLDTYCINSGIFVVPNPVGIKWMLSYFKFCENYLRPPLYSPDLNEIQQLTSILEQLEKNKVTTICH
jgi:4-hydroxy-tetrahydrodipicolinate synthase